MKISSQRLALEAEATGFRADVLEKVAQLLRLLEALQGHPFLKEKMVLKGGTALNLFVFDVPRLSVDIDLNVVETEEGNDVLSERPQIEQAVQAVFIREGFTVRRIPAGHAGGKWLLRYENAAGLSGNLEVDINFMFRRSLWPVRIRDSHPVGAFRATGIPVLDPHELAAGKLAALLSRKRARDLFDCHRILQMDHIEDRRLRVGFVVYGAMNRKDWRSVSTEDVDFDPVELVGHLIPVLRISPLELGLKPAEYGERLVNECRAGLSAVLPFTEPEREFLNRLLDHGEIDPTVLTADPLLQQRIQAQPLLAWKALNVRRHPPRR